MVFGNRFRIGRSNSKASYLPRQQPRDKLHSDPDHGSYKLTLTSNEDSINHHSDVVFPEEIIATPTKCNLPDVLPPGVKYSLYSNNNNNNNNNNSNGKMGKQLPPPKTVPHSAPIISANSLKSMFNFTPQQPQQNQVTPPSASSPVTPPPAYSTVAASAATSSQPGSPTNQQQAISPKYTSQSTFDLKKTQILDSKYLSQSPAQIGLPPIPPLPTTNSPNESINNTNYLNQQHSANNSCNSTNSNSPNQQTVNNCNEFSEKVDNLELNTAANTSTSPIEPAESNLHNTQPQQQSSPPPYDFDDSAPKEEEDRTISSSSTSTSAEANQHQHQSDSALHTTCSNDVDSTAVVTPAVLECVTKEINLEVAPLSERPSSPKVLQRTEIVLRVAAPTTEASSQTDDDLDASTSNSTSSSPRSPRSPPATLSLGISELVLDQGALVTRHSVATSTSGSPTGSPRSPPSTPTATTNGTGNKSFFSKACTAAPRKVHPEEIDCDKLSHDLILQLSPSDKLHTILAPKTFKSSSDYVSDLFNIQIAPRPMKKDASTATPEASPQKSPLDILTTSSTYFQVSEPKAKLMTRYSREMTLINGDCCDLTKKKEELVQRLGKKLLVLSNEQTSIAEESNANDLLGADVALKVAQKCRPSDASKFRSYVDDVGYITMLLLSLSGRLARTDNALHTIVDDSHPDKKILEAKRDRLLEQLDEAKQLKDDIDRRGAIISKVLEKSLTIEEYADYDYFINMKAKLIVDSREIADKIKLGEEQLVALKDTLVQSEC